MMSTVHPITDSTRTSPEVRFVPAADSRTESNIGAIAANHSTDVEKSGFSCPCQHCNSKSLAVDVNLWLHPDQKRRRISWSRENRLEKKGAKQCLDIEHC
jgi:hypothetical protein